MVVPPGYIPASDAIAGTNHIDIGGQLYELPKYPVHGGLAGPSQVFQPPDILSPGNLLPADVRTRGSQVLQNLLNAPVAGGALRGLGAVGDFVNEQIQRGAFGGPQYDIRSALGGQTLLEGIRNPQDVGVAGDIAVNTAFGAVGALEGAGKKFVSKLVGKGEWEIRDALGNVIERITQKSVGKGQSPAKAAAERVASLNATATPGAATNEALATARGEPVAPKTGAALKPGSSAAEVSARRSKEFRNFSNEQLIVEEQNAARAAERNKARYDAARAKDPGSAQTQDAGSAARGSAMRLNGIRNEMFARGVSGPIASNERRVLESLTDEQLNAVRTTPNLPTATKAAVDAEVGARVNKGMGITPEAQITGALRQVSSELKDEMRRIQRSPALDDTAKKQFADKAATEIDAALTKAKVPVTDENRFALAVRISREQAGRNTAAAKAAEAKVGASKANAPAPEIPLAKAPPGVPPEEMPQAIIRHRGPVGEVIDFLRTSKTILDVSQLFRQGLWAITSNALSTSAVRRTIARDAFRNAFRGYSRGFAKATWTKAQADPLFEAWKKSGGIERDVAGSASRPGSTEEFFQSPFAERVPIMGTAVRGAESSFALTMNSLKFYSWKEAMEARGIIKGTVSEAEQKAFARYFNMMSGHAQGEKAEGAARALNDIFFASSFAISRVQLPFEVLTAKALREGMPHLFARQATDLVKVVSAGIGALMAAKAAGFEVGISPTGTDFGKIKVGDTQVDIWGGFQQPAVVVARLMLDAYTSSKGSTTSLSGATGVQAGAFDVAGRFIESKLGPAPGTIWALLKGEDYVGQPFGPRGGQTLEETLKSVFGAAAIPLSVADIVQAIQADVESGTSAKRGLPPGSLGALAGGSSFLGFGSSTRLLTKEQRAVEDLRTKYYAAPAFSIGSPQEWAAVYRALQQYRTLKGSKTVAQARADPKLREFYNSAAGGKLRIYVADSGTVRSTVISKERQALAKDPNFKKLGITLADIIQHLGQ